MVSKREIRKQRTARVQAERAADRAGGRQRRRKQRTKAIVAAVLAMMMILPLAAGLITVFTGGSTSSSTVTSTLPVTTTTIPPFVDPAATVAAPVPCPAFDGTEQRATSFGGPPPMCIDPALNYTAEVVTDMGTVVLSIDPSLDTEAANLFVVMANYRYFEGLPIFTSAIDGPAVTGDAGSIDPGFAVQATSAVAPDGSDSPYQVGSVVMAADQSRTINTRFAIVTTQAVADALASNPVNPVIGTVTSGLDVVTSIVEDQAAVLTSATDLVAWLDNAIRIRSVTVTSSAG